MRHAVMAAALLLAAPFAALAAEPEQLDQLEPGRGEWQAEYFGAFGSGDGREHSIEIMHGLSDRLALGIELETEYERGRLGFDNVGPKLLYRLTEEDARVAIGLQVQLGFDAEASLAESEARLIVSSRDSAWWAQANFMLRRTSEDGGSATGLAYAGSLQHALTNFAWFGIEASGQSAPFWRDGYDAADHGHFVGPSLTFDWEPSRGQEVEVGLAFLHRIAGEGAADTARLFVQFGF